MVYVVHLKKINSVHNNLSAGDYNGWCFELPTVGERFNMYTEPYEVYEELRMITTTEVKEVTCEPMGISGEVRFTTKNSAYELQYAKRLI